MVAIDEHTVTIQPDKADDRGLGLPKFPRLIFLDTNIVQNLWSFGGYVYDDSPTPSMESRLSASGDRFSEDICALADLMALGHRAGWPIAVSSRTLAELQATPRPEKRYALTNWGMELAYYFSAQFDDSRDAIESSSYSEISHFTHIQRRLLSELLNYIPQEADRQLIIDALEYGCDIFLTMDYKTVWQYRDEVSRFGIQVMRPAEFLEHIRPSAGLLR